MKFITRGNNNPEFSFNTFQEFLNIPCIYNMVNNSIVLFDRFSLSVDLETGEYLLAIIDITGDKWRLGLIGDVKETTEDNNIIQNIMSYRKKQKNDDGLG